MRFSFLLLIVCYQITFAQSETKQKVAFFKTRPNKGKLFIAYGWNRSVYSPSNIHFKGNDYDFTLAKVKASDRQSPFSFDLYFNPSTITIPQVNFKIGIFFHDHYSVSFNIDHMKYVMNQNQKVTISGFNYNPNSYLNGNYDQEFISLHEDFLTFEHTDGLNFVFAEVNRVDDILKWIKIDNNWIALNMQEGIGAGLVLPKTNVRLFNQTRNDVFYLSGYGFSANAGIQIRLLQYLYIEYQARGGFIDLPYIKTTAIASDKAKQNFWFLEHMISFGIMVKVFK